MPSKQPLQRFYHIYLFLSIIIFFIVPILFLSFSLLITYEPFSTFSSSTSLFSSTLPPYAFHTLSIRSFLPPPSHTFILSSFPTFYYSFPLPLSCIFSSFPFTPFSPSSSLLPYSLFFPLYLLLSFPLPIFSLLSPLYLLISSPFSYSLPFVSTSSPLLYHPIYSLHLLSSLSLYLLSSLLHPPIFCLP